MVLAATLLITGCEYEVVVEDASPCEWYGCEVDQCVEDRLGDVHCTISRYQLRRNAEKLEYCEEEPARRPDYIRSILP